MITLDWINLKKITDDKSLSIQYVELLDRYILVIYDGNLGFNTILKKSDPPSQDQLDFENNYKSEGNKKLESKNPTDGVIQVAPVEAEGNASTVITHDWTDNTTWLNGTADSSWMLEPDSGKIKIIRKAEVQFSHDVKLAGITKLRFDIWVYNPLFDPDQEIVSEDPTWYPNKEGEPFRNQLRFLYDRSEYSSVRDVLNYGNEHFTMPAVDDMINSMSTVQFNYARAISLKSSEGAQIRINLENDVPMQGEFCTISLIVRDEEEW